MWIPTLAVSVGLTLGAGAIAAVIGKAPVIYVILGSIAGPLFLLGVAWFLVVQGQKTLIKNRLGAFLEEGGALVHLCQDEKQPSPDDEANAWNTNTEAFLGKYLGDSYVARFHSGAGLSTGYTTLISLEHRRLMGGLRVRMARLNEFLQEMGS